MRCPKCRFVSSDKKDICPSCRIDLRPYKHFLGLPISNPKTSLTELLRQLTEGPKESPRPSLAKTEVLVRPSLTSPTIPEEAPDLLDEEDDEVDLLANTEVAKPAPEAPRENVSSRQTVSRNQSVSLIDKLKSSSALSNPHIRRNVAAAPASPTPAPQVDDALPLNVSGDFSASSDYEERNAVLKEEDDEEGLPLFHTRGTKSVLEAQRQSNFELSPENQRGTPYAPRVNPTPLVQPEVVEFNEDDDELIRELDAMIGDTEVNVSSVKVERPKQKEEPSNVFVEDDLEISFEFEMEGHTEQDENSSEETGAEDQDLTEESIESAEEYEVEADVKVSAHTLHEIEEEESYEAAGSESTDSEDIETSIEADVDLDDIAEDVTADVGDDAEIAALLRQLEGGNEESTNLDDVAEIEGLEEFMRESSAQSEEVSPELPDDDALLAEFTPLYDDRTSRNVEDAKREQVVDSIIAQPVSATAFIDTEVDLPSQISQPTEAPALEDFESSPQAQYTLNDEPMLSEAVVEFADVAVEENLEPDFEDASVEEDLYTDLLFDGSHTAPIESIQKLAEEPQVPVFPVLSEAEISPPRVETNLAFLAPAVVDPHAKLHDSVSSVGSNAQADGPHFDSTSEVDASLEEEVYQDLATTGYAVSDSPAEIPLSPVAELSPAESPAYLENEISSDLLDEQAELDEIISETEDDESEEYDSFLDHDDITTSEAIDQLVDDSNEISNAFETVLNGFAAQIHSSTGETYEATASGEHIVSSEQDADVDHLPSVEDYVFPIDDESVLDERPLVVDLESVESSSLDQLDSLQDQISPVMEGIEKSLSLLVQREYPATDGAPSSAESSESRREFDDAATDTAHDTIDPESISNEKFEAAAETTVDDDNDSLNDLLETSTIEEDVYSDVDVDDMSDRDQPISSSIIESLSSLIPMRAESASLWNDAISELQVWARYQQPDLDCLEFKFSELVPVSRTDVTDVLFSAVAGEIEEPQKARKKSSGALPNSESRRVESPELKQAVLEVTKEIVAEERASQLPNIGMASRKKGVSDSGTIEIEFYSPDRNQRLQAYITDMGAAAFLTFMIAAFSYLPSQVITSLLAGELPALNSLLPVLARLIGSFLFIAVVCSAILMAARGTTIGQKLMKLEVVDHHGMVPSFWNALLWSVLQFLHPLTLGLTALGALRPSGVTVTERVAAVRVVQSPE